MSNSSTGVSSSIAVLYTFGFVVMEKQSGGMMNDRCRDRFLEVLVSIFSFR